MIQAAIVGVAESDRIGKVPDRTALHLHAEAGRNALLEAGLLPRDVDAVFSAGMDPRLVAEWLGILPSHVDTTSVGGSSFVIHLGHAAAMIAAGIVQVALITHGESGRSHLGFAEAPQDDFSPMRQYERPLGLPNPVGAYALACARHMHEYGTTKEQLAEIAVATRKWAALNPKALYRDPISIEDVMASRPIAWPLNLLDCCVVTDAGGAVVVTSLDRARDLLRTPIAVLGYGEAASHNRITSMPDLTAGAARVSGERAFTMAGIAPPDVDVVQIYDSFTYTVLVNLEDLGFCKKGEGGPFVSGQRTAPGSGFPLNTNGGGLSYSHPGMFGIFTIIEAVRQLRHDYADEGIRQVADAELALVHGTGGVLSSAGTAILARAA